MKEKKTKPKELKGIKKGWKFINKRKRNSSPTFPFWFQTKPNFPDLSKNLKESMRIGPRSILTTKKDAVAKARELATETNQRIPLQMKGGKLVVSIEKKRGDKAVILRAKGRNQGVEPPVQPRGRKD